MSHVQAKRIFVLIVFLFLPPVAGILLTFASEGLASNRVSTQLQKGYPLPWKIVELVPCPPGPGDINCGVQVTLSLPSLALDWAFYSFLGYAIVATLALAERRGIGARNTREP